MEEQKRGQLTNRIKTKSKELFGYEISEIELHLMAYIQYVMVNDQRIEPRKINSGERTILAKWKKKNYIEGGALGLAITKEFWDVICEIVFLGYVDLK